MTPELMLVKKAIAQLQQRNEQQRKEQSQTETDIFTGNIRPYVEQAIADRFSATLVKEVPIVSAVNILRKEVEQKASLYKSEPTRTFEGVSDAINDKIVETYDSIGVDYTMLESNKLFELQLSQTHLLVEPFDGELKLRPIKAHNLTVIPNDLNPEVAEAYIISPYNRNLNEAFWDSGETSIDKIADRSKVKFILWSNDYHFVFDANGAIVSEDTTNPIGMIPIIEISAMKDWLYWREITNDSAQFTIDYNMSLSMLQQIVEMSSFAQAYLKSPEGLMPQIVDIGPNRILKLITNPDMENSDVEFGYASPNADITSAQNFLESILAQYLSSRGVENTLVSGKPQSDKYNSGVERLLAMIEKFEASKETMSLFERAEKKLFEVIKAYMPTLDNGFAIPDNATLSIQYAEPQGLLSENEKLDLAERKLELGVWDEVDVIEYLEGVERKVAEQIWDKKKLTQEEEIIINEVEPEVIEDDGQNP